MFLSPITASNYAFAFSSPAQSNPSRFFPALEAPADTLLAARADVELSSRLAKQSEEDAYEAVGYWRMSGERQRGEARRHALRTIRGYREARARAYAARKVLFKMLNAQARQEMAA